VAMSGSLCATFPPVCMHAHVFPCVYACACVSWSGAFCGRPCKSTPACFCAPLPWLSRGRDGNREAS
jgi:hypothetical protein